MVKGNSCTDKYSSFEKNLRKKIFKVKADSSEKLKRQSRIKQYIKNRGIKSTGKGEKGIVLQ